MKVHLVSLGCARNLVDSEGMLGRLKRAGWAVTDEPAEAEAIVVNTCSFIESAADESIDTILEAARYKREGRCRCLVVAGCLPQRYGERIREALPEVDGFLGTGAFDEIAQCLADCGRSAPCRLPDPDRTPLHSADAPRESLPGNAVYLKIAEGCSRRCTYCIIPRLRGNQRSRPVDDIVAEASRLAEAGARELNLVAQDATAWGRDLNPPSRLSRLLEALAEALPSVWVRVLYGHPESIDEETIGMVGRYDNICSYFDVPVQHASSRILRAMGRRGDAETLTHLFERIRSLVPEAALRTTVIVGFPGETDSDFRELERFVDRVRFDHLGAFIYSDAEDLPSHRLGGHVSQKAARKRYDRIMTLQRSISTENNRRHLGRRYPVLLEEVVEEGLLVGRTPFQAPDVDGVTYVTGKALEVGSCVTVTISDATEYDLSGEVV
ncbi:MAG: 30S ribosomal protein S12 methylthiotransferase RimO [Desulfobacteraceae bacterium]|nr:30S ribosomal protein S12 methylthiotransferase RimO [Desulfobacteraceae bacterium]